MLVCGDAGVEDGPEDGPPSGRGRWLKAWLILLIYELFRRDTGELCELAYGAALRLYLVTFDANDGGNAHAGFVGEFLLSQEGRACGGS